VITKKMEIRFYRHRTEYGGVQKLEQAYYLFGFCVWRTVLDEEEVPSWAEIQVGTLGSTSWRSKFRLAS
jgi:hypothetical protein